MYSIGIDIGSTYTKYCIKERESIISCVLEKTTLHQKEHFENVISELLLKYPKAEIVSCGYGKNNISGIEHLNELVALARGVYYVSGKDGLVLDIGGQDTKIILQEQGKLKRFFVNDKCAAGSGMFLTSVLGMIGISFDSIRLGKNLKNPIHLSSNCAVFAQSEIVEMISDNKNEDEIIHAVLQQIFTSAKRLISKVESMPVYLTGGLSQIEGISEFASDILGIECRALSNGTFLAAIGCTDCIGKY